MIIIFYDANDEKLYICSPHEKTKIVNISDPDVMDYIPNDDILYVTNGHYFEKRQFAEYLQGSMHIEEEEDAPVTRKSNRWAGFLNDSPPRKQNASDEDAPEHRGPRKNRYYIHPTGNGTILIEDLITTQEPKGVCLNGKWDFRSIDELGGQDAVDESAFLRVLIARNKVEVVDEEFYQQNKHKQKNRVSPSERELNRILVPTGMRAEDVAATGGLGYEDVAIPIYVEG